MYERDIKRMDCAGGGGEHTLFAEIICLENLFFAWNEFKRGKEQKIDVQKFALEVEDHLFDLYDELLGGTYQHSAYEAFYVCDPKLRHIHKPAVRDRVLHHAIVMAIEPLFENVFIFNSYSSRKNKGTHRAVGRLRRFAWRLSHNNTKTVWILHCDVRRFFDSVDHDMLLHLMRQKVNDHKVMGLIEQIVRSFEITPGKGIPLGNLTSQLFSNIYLNQLDQFITKTMGLQGYIRYADDVAFVGRSKIFLESLIPIVQDFLENKLKLTLHPRKIVLRKWHQGVDFLGYVIFPHYTILRTKTKHRMLRRLTAKRYAVEQGLLDQDSYAQCVQSYLGMLKHCRGWRIEKMVAKILSSS